MSFEPVVDIEHAVVLRSRRPVVKEISLDASPGEVLGLLGPNGAGKSTLLQGMAGLLALDAGRSHLNGRAIAQYSAAELARTRSYQAQVVTVQWPMSVQRVVELGRLPHGGMRDASDTEIVDRAIASVDLDMLRDRRLDALSGGELMRVHLARLFAVDAPIVFADEPIAGLDPYQQLHALELFHDQARLGRTVVLVLHDLSMAARFCDRLALLHEGRLVALGTPDEVLTAENLREVFAINASLDLHGPYPMVLPTTRSD